MLGLKTAGFELVICSRRMPVPPLTLSIEEHAITQRHGQQQSMAQSR